MDTLFADLRYAARTLARNPGFAAVAILTLALGIGTTSAVFSVVDGVLLHPLPYRDADRLYTMLEQTPAGAARLASYPAVQDWQEGQNAFDVAYTRGNGVLYRTPDGPERLLVAYVSPNWFATLQPLMTLGRPLTPADDAGGGHVVVLSQHLWRARFGGDGSVLGRTITLGDDNATVVGVMGAGADYPEWADLWQPVGAIVGRDEALQQRGFHVDSRTIGRLKPGIPLERGRAELDAVAARLAQLYPAQSKEWTQVREVPMLAWVLGFADGNPVKTRLYVLAGAVALVLLIACANVTNLLLARALARGKEIAIRGALGAGRGRVARQLLTESATLAAAGGGLGVLLAYWLVDVLRRVGPDNLPRLQEATINGAVLAFAAATAVVVALLVGLAPAIRSSAPNLTDALKSGSAAGRGHHRLRNAIVTAELAVAVTLTAGAGLLIKSLWKLAAVNPGFNADHLVTVSIAPRTGEAATPAAAAAYYRRMYEAVRPLPGLSGVGLTNHVPLAGRSFPSTIVVPGSGRRATESGILFREISPTYFATMEIPMRRGRALTDADLDGPPVAVLNETAARQYFPRGGAIGSIVTLFKSAQGRPDFGQPFQATVVGIAGDVRHFALDGGPTAEVYLPYTVNPWGYMSLVMRTPGDPSSMLPVIRRALLAADPELPVADVRDGLQVMDIGATLGPQRLNTGLLGSFALTALLLSAIGLYGLMAYHVTRRTHEIGIRMALGAVRGHVVGLVLRDALVLAAAGLALGLAGAVAAGRALQGLLFGTQSTDAATLIGVAVALMLVVLLAAFIPARRATRVNPLTALRYE